MRYLSRFWVAGLFCAVAGLPAQQVIQVADPANLTGEHVMPQSPADTLPINHGAAALQQLLLKLRTRASFMLIVAHPDDEDNGTLTYLSRGLGVRAATLTLTRGEGGQNFMSADFNDALGLIRTQELLVTGRYMGTDQMFGTEVDFGFSKTKEESFAKWSHDRVLYDAVRAVRLYRPLVIASVFVGGPTDGHGQHQVSGEIAQEVFNAAADPKVFPEMIKEGLLPWAALKVYAGQGFGRVTAEGMYDSATGKTMPARYENYVTGVVTNKPAPNTVMIPQGDQALVWGKPALGMDGMTYSQFAFKGRAQQKSQVGVGGGGGGGGPVGAGRGRGYALMASRVGAIPEKEDGVFEGIDTSLGGIADLASTSPINLRAGLAEIDQDLAAAQMAFDPDHVESSAAPLRGALHKLDTLLKVVDQAQFEQPEAKANVLHELRIKRVQLNNALVLALGLKFDVSTVESNVVSTEAVLPVLTKLSNEGASAVTYSGVVLPAAAGQKKVAFADASLAPRAGFAREERLEFAAGLQPTRPYFSRKDVEQAVYDIAQPSLRNAPQTPAPLVLTAHVQSDGVELEMQGAVHGPLGADGVVENTMVIPPISISVTPSVGIIRPQDRSIDITAKVQSKSSVKALGGVMLYLNNGTKSYGERLDTSAVKEKDSVAGEDEYVGLKVATDKLKGRSFTLTAVMKEAQKDYAESFRHIGYKGLTYTNLYSPATYRATAVEVTTAPNLKVAYLPGTGDEVPDFLPDLGVKPVMITPKDLTAENLKQYDVVLLGVRAYVAQSALAGTGSKPLIEYARNGGVVVVQYMTARYGDAEAPYPITVPGDASHNVVEEVVPVTLLAPEAPLMNWPNKITAADFDHWVEERGHGFATSWDSHYQPLLEMHDPEQDPQKGGLLLAPVGKGAYIYCSLALYRQLPEGVPGAYRLFANLLSYGKNPKR